MNLHETLIAEILSAPQTPKEHAAKSEIEGLRAQLAALRLRLSKTEETIDMPAPRAHKAK